jgi:hypothetical protein
MTVNSYARPMTAHSLRPGKFPREEPALLLPGSAMGHSGPGDIVDDDQASLAFQSVANPVALLFRRQLSGRDLSQPAHWFCRVPDAFVSQKTGGGFPPSLSDGTRTNRVP